MFPPVGCLAAQVDESPPPSCPAEVVVGTSGLLEDWQEQGLVRP